MDSVERCTRQQFFSVDQFHVELGRAHGEDMIAS